MFFRRKKKAQQDAAQKNPTSSPSDENNSTVDKIVMGAIIGTAIGSAIGASMAPKKGKETREVIAERVKSISSEAKEVQSLTKETASGFWNLTKRLIFGKKKKKTEVSHMREIPMETDIIPPEYVEKNQ